MGTFIYFIPLIPLIIRLLFVGLMKGNLNQILSEKENDRSEIRSYLLSLGGFSFTALIALSILQPTLNLQVQSTIYYIFLSFLCYFFALNLQGYKSKRWHDILSDTLIETASLCLILSIICLLFISKLNPQFIYSISIFAILVWLLDFIIRLNIQIKHLNNKEKKNE